MESTRCEWHIKTLAVHPSNISADYSNVRPSIPCEWAKMVKILYHVIEWSGVIELVKSVSIGHNLRLDPKVWYVLPSLVINVASEIVLSSKSDGPYRL